MIPVCHPMTICPQGHFKVKGGGDYRAGHVFWGWADTGVMSFSGIHIGGSCVFLCFRIMNYAYNSNLGQIL